MGQKLGRAALCEPVQSFTNVTGKTLKKSWKAFQSVASGYGLNKHEINAICTPMKEELHYTDIAVAERSASLFETLDTDHNGIVDALELFCVLAMVSAMTQLDIIHFLLSMYDFDNLGTLSMHEVTMAARVASMGLCKVEKQEGLAVDSRQCPRFPNDEEIVQLIEIIFLENSPADADDFFRFSIDDFAGLLLKHPLVAFWLNFYSFPDQTGFSVYQITSQDRDYATDHPIIERSGSNAMAIEWDVRCERPPFIPDPLADTAEDPWLKAVQMLTPLDYADGEGVTSKAPDTALVPEWVYGYHSERCRNNLHYNVNGHVVYHISKYAIVYDIENNYQNIFDAHTDEIICLKLHPDRTIVASGDLAPRPKLIVWNSITKEVLYSTRGVHANSVNQISFSPDGQILASISSDIQHSFLLVVQWETDTIIFSDTVATFPHRALACAVLADNTVVVGGEAFVNFWNYFPVTGLLKRAGKLLRPSMVEPITNAQAVLFGTVSTNKMVASSSAGNLSLWEDVSCVQHIKGHNGTINCLLATRHFIISAGVDLKIRLWQMDETRIHPASIYDVAQFGVNPIIRSLCLSHDGNKIIFGTRGCNVYEIDAASGAPLRPKALLCGHRSGKVTSVAVHPTTTEFVTVGTDATLRRMDRESKRELQMSSFEGDISVVTYNLTGELLIIAFGGSPKTVKCGSFVILNNSDFSIVHECKDSRVGITVVRYSPDGKTLAVGAEDGAIFLYAIEDGYDLIGRCIRHQSKIMAIDFSTDGEWLRSNSEDKMLFFFNADDATFQSNVASMRDLRWQTHSCLYSWHLRSVHRSPYQAVERVLMCEMPAENAPHVCLATNTGYLRLHSFPCAVPDDRSECHRYYAHCGEVASIRYAADQSTLFSVGLTDRCVVQWKVLRPDTEVQRVVVKPVEAEVVKSTKKSIKKRVSTPEKKGRSTTPEKRNASPEPKRSNTPDNSSVRKGGTKPSEPKLSAKQQKARNEAASKEQISLEQAARETMAKAEAALTAELPTPSNDIERKLQTMFCPESSSAPIGRINAAKRSMGSVLAIDHSTIPCGEDKDEDAERGYRVLESKLAPHKEGITGEPHSHKAADTDIATVWLQDVVEPSIIPPLRTELPDFNLSLGHIYGYGSQFTRNDVRYTPSGDIAYAVSSFGIVLGRKTRTQQLHKFHTDAVSAFCATIDGSLIATGCIGHHPKVAIWDAITCQTVQVIEEEQLYGVCGLAFSKSGKYLAVVNMDESHTVTVYNWRSNLVVCKAYAGNMTVLGCCFFGSEDEKGDSGTSVINTLSLVVYGRGELLFFRAVTSRFPECIRPSLGKLGVSQSFVCCEVFMDCPTIGTCDGSLYIFRGNRLAHCVKAHNGAVNALHAHDASALLVSGGTDGMILLWNASRESVKQFHVDSLVLSHNPSVRSAAFSADGSRLIIGTFGSDIFEVSIRDGKLVNNTGITGGSGALVEGHGGEKQLFAMAAHPTNPTKFASAGFDGIVRLWDSKIHHCLRSVKLGFPMRSMAFSWDGKWLAVGYSGHDGNPHAPDGGDGPRSSKSGYISVLKGEDLKTLFETKVSDDGSSINAVAFTPSGAYLAIGCADAAVYLYDTKKTPFLFARAFECHTAPVRWVDFSVQGDYICTADNDHRIAFSAVQTGEQCEHAAAVKDTKWLTTSAPIGWPLQGFWAGLKQYEKDQLELLLDAVEGTEEADRIREQITRDVLSKAPSVAQRSSGGFHVAVGNQGGSIEVAHFPCLSRDGFLLCRGHAGPVSQVIWAQDDGAMFSCGARDHTIMQWNTVPFTAVLNGGTATGVTDDDDDDEVELEYTLLAAGDRSDRSGGGGIEAQHCASVEMTLKHWTERLEAQRIHSTTTTTTTTSKKSPVREAPTTVHKTMLSIDTAPGPVEAGENSGNNSVAPGSENHSVAEQSLASQQSKGANKSQNTSAPTGRPSLHNVTAPSHTMQQQQAEGITAREAELWRGKVPMPTNALVAQPRGIPTTTFLLEGVHGIQLDTVGNGCAACNEDDSAVWIAASVGVVFNRNTLKQSFYMGHRNRTLISLAVDKAGRLAATGELHENPEIHVWDTKSCRSCCILTNAHRDGVTCLSFSESNAYLLSAGRDCLHSIAVFYSPNRRWTDGFHICSTSVGPDPVLWCSVAEGNAYPFAVGGVNADFSSSASSSGRSAAANIGISFFRLVKGGVCLEKRLADLGEQAYAGDVLCCCLAVPGQNCLDIRNKSSNVGRQQPRKTGDRAMLLCGTATGYIYICRGAQVVGSLRAHSAAVTAICTSRKGFISVCAHGIVKHWSNTHKLLHTYNASSFSAVKKCDRIDVSGISLYHSRTRDTCVVGTSTGELTEVCLLSHTSAKLLESHSKLQLRAVCVCNTKQNADLYATGGDDGVVRIWSLTRQCCVRSCSIGFAVRAMRFSPSDEQLVVGIGGDPLSASRDGMCVVLRCDTLSVVAEYRIASRSITAIKFSPSGLEVGIASEDGLVYLCNFRESFYVTEVVDMTKQPQTEEELSLLDQQAAAKAANDEEGASAAAAQAAAAALVREALEIKYPLVTFDFSSDDEFLRILNDQGNIGYYSRSMQKLVESAVEVSDVVWNDPTCLFRWSTIGALRHDTQIVATCVGKVAGDLSKGEHPIREEYLVATYANGDIHVFKNPCMEQTNQQNKNRQMISFKSIHGVGSAVHGLTVSQDGKHLLVLDSANRAVLQYAIM